MNCPSRTDDVDWNPGWNQNPPFLAADLTTCEDLNGMINARALKRKRRAGDNQKDEEVAKEYEARLLPAQPEGFRTYSTAKDWAWWILSVLCTSFLLSNIHAFKVSNLRWFFEHFQKGTMGE
jgi:hypothetical protein